MKIILTIVLWLPAQCFADVTFVLTYDDGDAEQPNKFTHEKFTGRTDDPYLSKDSYRSYLKLNKKRKKKSFSQYLTMDSKVKQLFIRGAGLYKVEYRIKREAIVYENAIRGGALSIKSYGDSLSQQSMLREIKPNENKAYDLSQIRQNMSNWEVSLPNDLKKHCSDINSYPCGTRVSFIEIFVSKQIPQYYTEILPVKPSSQEFKKMWVPLFDISLEILPNFSNEKNFRRLSENHKST